MSEYVMIYRNSAEAHRQAMGSPERAQQSMAKWRAWMDEMARKGQLVNVGQPLERVGRVVSGQGRTVTDGPFAETKDVIGGFSIIAAGDVDEAVRIAAGCPALEGGGSVEVRPVLHMDL